MYLYPTESIEGKIKNNIKIINIFHIYQHKTQISFKNGSENHI